MVRAFVWGQEMDHSGKYIADDLQKIGINLLLAGELDAAIDHFRQATDIYHVVPWALEWEAAAHWLKGAPAGAVQCWLRALECPYQSLGHLPKYLYFSAVRGLMQSKSLLRFTGVKNTLQAREFIQFRSFS